MTINPKTDDFRLFSTAVMPEFEQDEFDALLNFDAVGGDGSWNFDDGGVHGFTVDMDWLGTSSGSKNQNEAAEDCGGITLSA